MVSFKYRGGMAAPRNFIRRRNFYGKSIGSKAARGSDFGTPGFTDSDADLFHAAGQSHRYRAYRVPDFLGRADNRHRTVQSRRGYGDDADGRAYRLGSYTLGKSAAVIVGRIPDGPVYHRRRAGSDGIGFAGEGRNQRDRAGRHGRRRSRYVSDIERAQNHIQEKPFVAFDVLLYASVCAGVTGRRRRKRGLYVDRVRFGRSYHRTDHGTVHNGSGSRHCRYTWR